MRQVESVAAWPGTQGGCVRYSLEAVGRDVVSEMGLMDGGGLCALIQSPTHASPALLPLDYLLPLL